LTLDYEATFATVEFHRLAVASVKPYQPGPEQLIGHIPRMDKDYLRTIETETLSELAQNVRTLSQNVGDLTTYSKIIGALTIGVLLTVVGFGLAALLA